MVEARKITAMLTLIYLLSLFVIAGPTVYYFVIPYNRKMNKMLKEARDESKEMSQTLANILDGDGEVVGQLALPGISPVSETLQKILEAQGEMEETKKELDVATAKLKEAKEELENTIDKENQTALTLAEIVDSEGKVLHKIKIPTKPIANKTPCGSMCMHCNWSEENSKGEKEGVWRCNANQGRTADLSRPVFLDDNNQCTMFNLSKNYHYTNKRSSV